MSVYMIIEIQIKDGERYAEYVRRVPPVIERHGGRYLVRGGEVVPLSGNWKPERVIVIEFLSLAELRSCFGSAEYLELAPLREQSTVSRAILVEGCG